MRSLAYVRDEVWNQVPEGVERAERKVHDTATHDHKVAAKKLQLPRPLKDALDTRKWTESLDGHQR